MGGLASDDGSRRPRDWAYIARVPAADLPVYQEMVQQIRRTHNVQLIEEFNEACERGDSRFLQVTKSEDLAVNGGIQQCINIILGTSSARWTHIGFGSLSTPPTVSDTVLATEATTARVPVSTMGWAEAKGMRLFFGAVSAQAEAGSAGYSAPFAPAVMAETGVFNAASGGTMLNRSIFTPKFPDQQPPGFAQVSTAPIVVSVVIEFCPVA